MKTSERHKLRASLELLTSTVIWGFGFVATAWALKSVDTITLSIFRFTVAGAIGVLALYIFKLKSEIHLNNLRMSCGPGVLLGLMLITQTWGLELTSVTNSGFITTLYVVFVPLIEYFFLRKKASKIVGLWITLSIIGVGFMVQLTSLKLNFGDLLTLLCALFAAGQIVWVSHISDQIRSSFAFNVFQSFWGAITSLLFWPIYQNFYFYPPDTKAVIGITSVTIGSTLIAFALQIKAQKVIPAVTAGLFFLFESPFAALFAVFLMAETVNKWQALGATLIFISAVGATLTIKSKNSIVGETQA